MRQMRIGVVLCAAVAFGWISPADADINLEWRPPAQTVNVGDLTQLGLYAVSDDPEFDQLFSAIDLVFAWDPAYLGVVGVNGTGGAALLASGFPNNPLNELFPSPPQDGDGFYIAFASLGSPVPATPAGTLVSTFEFWALADTPVTTVEMLPSLTTEITKVYDGTVPNLNVTGTLGSADINIIPEPACLLFMMLGTLLVTRRR